MGELIVTIVVTFIASGLLSGLGVSIFRAIKNKDYRQEPAWKQRDSQRHRADALHEALLSHRTLCHKQHGMAYSDMDPFPGRDKEKKDG